MSHCADQVLIHTRTDYYTLSSFMNLQVAQILVDSLLSCWPVVSKFNAAIIDYGRILKAAVQQIMRVCKVHVSITLRKVQRHSRIVDTQNVTDDSSRGTVTWAMPSIATYTSSCSLFIDILDPATDSQYLCTST